MPVGPPLVAPAGAGSTDSCQRGGAVNDERRIQPGADRGRVERDSERRIAPADDWTDWPPTVSSPLRRPRSSTRFEIWSTVEATGFDRLLVEQRATWARRWADADIRIEGDDELERAVRFGLFHLMGSVGDSGEAAVGARGISGNAYRGHVFWDSDVFVLPFLAATHPASARAMLEYRLRRLPAAREAAAALGRRGARFPWESARTGFDVTPRSSVDHDGRRFEILTGDLEEHIVADVAWAAEAYQLDGR